MVWTEQLSRCNFGQVCFNNGDFNKGACNLFEEMPASDSRSPSRVLEVTIHRVLYPISESILLQIFGPFGVVEQVHVLGGSNHVLARVVFQSKYEAAEAYGDLHGRNIYDGCCQMEIKWGFSQESDVSLVTSNGYTDASSSSKLFLSVSADINWGSSQEVSCWSSQEVSCCDNLARSSSSMLQASATSTIMEGQGPDSSLAAAAAVMATNVVPICDVTGIEPPTTYSMLGLDITGGVNQEVAAFPHVEALSENLNSNNLSVDANAIGGHGQGLAIATTHDCISIAAPSITVPYVMDSDVINELQVPDVLMDASDASGRSFRDDSVIVLWALPMRCAEWQPWPPPMPSGISCDSIGMWPMPWPSLAIAHAIANGECYRLPRKPPWPPQAQRDFRFLPADMLQYLEFMRLTPVRVAELNPWPPPVLKEIGEFLCAKSTWSLLILIQESRQRECIAPDQQIFSILTVEMVQLLECMIPSTVLLVSTWDKVVLGSRWNMHTLVGASTELSQKLFKWCGDHDAVLVTQLNIMQHIADSIIAELWNNFLCITNTSYLMDICEMLDIWGLMERANLFKSELEFKCLHAETDNSHEHLAVIAVSLFEINPKPSPMLSVTEFVLYEHCKCGGDLSCAFTVSSQVEWVQLWISLVALLKVIMQGHNCELTWVQFTVVAVRRSYGVLRASVSLLDMKPIPTYVTATKCFATTKCIIMRVSSSSRSSAYQISVYPDAKQCYVDIIMIHGQPYILQRQCADPLQSKRYGAAQLFHCIAAPYDQARHQGEKKVNNVSMSCTQLAWDPGGGMTRDGATCYVVLNYQQRHVSSSGFHCYAVTYTVFMTEPMIYDTKALVFKFSPQQLATCKEMLRVEILAVTTEHNCLLICTGLLMEGAGCFLQTPWDPGGSEFLFDGNDGSRFSKSCLRFASKCYRLLGALHFSSYGWLMVLIRDIASLLLDTFGITFVLNLSIYRLEGKSDLKKGGMSGNVYMEMGRRMGYGLWRVGLLLENNYKKEQQQ